MGMDYKTFKLIQQYNRVIMWNSFAGKDENSDKSQQHERVIEEIDEFEAHTNTPVGENHAMRVKVLDDICDIFVTASFLDYMTCGGKSCSLYGMPQNERIQNIVRNGNFHELRDELYVVNALYVVNSIINTPNYDDIDFVGAIEHVVDSNFSKFIPRGANALLEAALVEFAKKGEDVYVVDSNLYHVIKRKSDDKIMKPKICFREPQLDKFIKKGA
jgi:hypothetical protein